MKRRSGDDGDGIRRFLDDLRYSTDRRGGERRGGERRGEPADVLRERRVGERRSGADRRASERRSGSLGAFSTQDTERIREMLSQPEADCACPRCHGNLLRGPTAGSPGLVMQEVQCSGCRHSALIVWR